MGRSLWPCVSGWLAVMTLMGWLFASCDNEETGVPASLPDGKYPLSMTAEINQLQTRAGGKDAWAGSEEIEVLLDGMLSPKRYVMNVSSNAVPKDAGNTITGRTPPRRASRHGLRIYSTRMWISPIRVAGMSVSISCTPPPWGVMTRPSTSVSTTGW